MSGTLRRHWPTLAVVVIVAGLAGWLLAFPVDWSGDLRPAPDAVEYAVTAQRLAQGQSFVLPLPTGLAPPRYPFGFPALIAPAYWLPGAELRSGLLAVIAWGVLGAVLVALLAQRLWGGCWGLLSGSTLLLLPPYLDWHRAIMSETTTAALSAACLLLFWQALHAASHRQRQWWLLGLGGVLGLAVLVRLNNVVLLPACLGGLLTGLWQRDNRVQALRPLGVVLVGPLLALLVLGIYAWATFGSPLGTGYRYWVPEWYASLHDTFALRYAVTAPALAGDLHAPPDLPNLFYYARSLTGLLPNRHSWFLSTGLAITVLVGGIAALRDQRSMTRAVLAWGVTLTSSTLLLFGVYFLADVRFLAPLAPLAALASAGCARAGAGLLRRAMRQRNPRLALPQALGGALLIALTVQALFTAAPRALADCYQCQRLTGQAEALRQPTPALATLLAYRDQTSTPALLVTDLLPPLLGASGVINGRTVVPLTRGEYWGNVPLRDTPPVVDRQRIILAALHSGIPVYLDSYSLGPIERQGSGDIARFLAAHQAHLEPHYQQGEVTIYRLVADQ